MASTTVPNADTMLPSRDETQELLMEFPVPYQGCGKTDMSFDLAQQLNLGVGGDGVIGRRVQLVADSPSFGERVLREGVMGWN